MSLWEDEVGEEHISKNVQGNDDFLKIFFSVVVTSIC